MFRIWMTVMLMAGVLLGKGPVLKTGQSAIYKQGDDGTYRSGLARSYFRSTAGVVTDRTTGLEWQDNYADNAGEIPSGVWEELAPYCAGLALDGGGWRGPTIEELKSLVDYSRLYPSIDPVFRRTALEVYWAADENVDHEHVGWDVSFYFGNDFGLYKDSHLYMRCVRGETFASTTYVRDDAAQSVQDMQNALVWQDDNVSGSEWNGHSFTRVAPDLNWTDAIDYCESLQLGGRGDWRLPNINELYTLADRSIRTVQLDPAFDHVTYSYYWSSSTFEDNASRAWGVSFYSGVDGIVSKQENYPVRCVRGGTVESGPKMNAAILMYLLN